MEYPLAPWLPNGRKIHRVPEFLRQDEPSQGAYDPKVVSFGPYHYGKLSLQLCQSAKPYALRIFLEGSNNTQQFYMSKILEIIDDARSCYYDGATTGYNDENFALMLLLDSCFLMAFMSIGDASQISWLLHCYIGGWAINLINRDIFLLENQIPFRVLTLLVKLRYPNGEQQVSKFVHTSIWGKYEQHHIDAIHEKQRQDQPLSLFDFFRRVLVWDWIPPKGNEKQQGDEDIDTKKHHKSFRSAKDLKAKGIHFRPSSVKSLKAIEFKSFSLYGQLELPTWFVSSFSKVFFPNMIAYELCPNNLVGYSVIGYINFMKSLIYCAGDVKELREKRILLTTLGSDEDVVKFYRELNTHGMGMGEIDSFMEVKERIQRHYDSNAKTWMAELIFTYFGSPWSIIAWLAAFILLIMTVVQTYFTVKSSK